MSDHRQYYSTHIDTLQARTAEAIQRESLDGLVIHSGQLKRLFLDDNHYPFKVNPHFKSWLPVVDNPNSWLVVDGVSKPKLIFYRPEDFWHRVPPEQTGFWVDFFEIIYLEHANSVEKYLPYDKAKYAYIGEYLEVANALGFEIINPDKVMNYLHWERAYKTDYELECMRKANKIAIQAHQAAESAFRAGLSEFEINSRYLVAASQGDNEVPYSNIIALNQHCSILHYTVADKKPPEKVRSFLIDAGASYQGYAADITRTYSASQNEFSNLIASVDLLCQQLCEQLKPGVSYTDVHRLAYFGVAKLLTQFSIVNLPPEDCEESGIVSYFFPHGIGHFLGLQVHDVGGHMLNDRGATDFAPDQHPFLRCTREIEPRQVFTIEPGLYFIDSLLNRLKGSENTKYINWDRVEQFRPYGGVRVEDNLVIHPDRVENMTRENGLP